LLSKHSVKLRTARNQWISAVLGTIVRGLGFLFPVKEESLGGAIPGTLHYCDGRTGVEEEGKDEVLQERRGQADSHEAKTKLKPFFWEQSNCKS
jgi:hypothetical protein